MKKKSLNDADLVAYLLGDASPELVQEVEKRKGDPDFDRELDLLRQVNRGLKLAPIESFYPQKPGSLFWARTRTLLYVASAFVLGMWVRDLSIEDRSQPLLNQNQIGFVEAPIGGTSDISQNIM